MITCKFPFWYGGKVHFRCTNATRSDLPHGSQWCPIDSKKLNFKSIAICRESCLQSKYVSCYSCLTKDFFGKINLPHSVAENLSIIMIAGGENLNSVLASAEFISETNNNNNGLTNLPKSIFFNPSMFLHNETIMICGGSNNLKTCLKLEEGKWTEYNSLKEERRDAAVVSTTTSTFIFGGSRSRDTYEYLEKNASEWILGKTKIPGGFSQGCSIAKSPDEIWLIGGSGAYESLSFNVTNQTFTELRIQLKQVGYGHQCAFIPGTRNIFATGGIFSGSEDSTEIIDVESRNVTKGPSMKSKRAYHGIGVLNIEGHERVVVFGGQSSLSSYLKSVEVYNAQTQKWELTNIELSEAKKNFGFMTIKSQP